MEKIPRALILLPFLCYSLLKLNNGDFVKTTSVDFFSSIVPGLHSLNVMHSLKSLKTEENVLQEVQKITYQDQVFKSFITFFELTEISPELVINAIIHSSFGNEYSISSLQTYERLEFLGDSVLELLITEKLLRSFPTLSEGALSKLRGQLVRKSELAKLGKMMGLNHFVLVGKGEHAQKVYEKESILADIFESILGAVYQSAGIEITKKYLEKVFEIYREKYDEDFISVSRVEGKNYKGRLQEHLMKLKKDLPKYTDVEVENGEFLTTVTVDHKIIGRAINKSKKLAQTNAAKSALEYLTQ